jgi:glucosyl-dolichyl phosphate glucuronosyltransferase
VISVIICTFNRDRILNETVRSFLNCDNCGIDYELLIVDNNSTDGTRESVKKLAEHNHQIRYIFEPSQGLSYARNSGIRESRGELVAFVDDDVHFSPNWITAFASILERNTDAACAGGKVVVHFDSGRPQWIDDGILWIYGITQYGDRERELQFPEFPRGGNMVIRRSLIDRIGTFHTSLGRRGKDLLSCDENEFFLRVAKSGMKMIYSPDAQIFHRIQSSRTSKEWILRRYYWEGVSVAAMRQLGEEPPVPRILARHVVGTVVTLLHQLKDMAELYRGRRDKYKELTFRKRLDIYYGLGELRQTIICLFAPRCRNTSNSVQPCGDE